MLDLQEKPRPAPAAAKKPPVKERAAEQASALSPEQQAAIRSLANDLHRLNQSVMLAVEAGLSVELARTARHHSGGGHWGDLLTPIIVKAETATNEQPT